VKSKKEAKANNLLKWGGLLVILAGYVIWLIAVGGFQLG
jgi:CHASE3 domain sensor protein